MMPLAVVVQSSGKATGSGSNAADLCIGEEIKACKIQLLSKFK